MYELRYDKIPFRIIRKNYEDEAFEAILKGLAEHISLSYTPVIMEKKRMLRYDVTFKNSVNDKPYISIFVDENDNIENYKCLYCGDYTVSYHACKHLLAVAKIYDSVKIDINIDELNEKFDKLEKEVIRAEYQAKRKMKLSEIKAFIDEFNKTNIIPLFEKVDIDSYITGDSGNYQLSFKIGNDKKFVIQNIMNFIEAVNNSESLQYGKKFSFIHNINNFSDFSKEVIKYMQSTEYNNISKFENLTPIKIEKLFDLYVNKYINIKIGDEFRKVYISSDKKDISYYLNEKYELSLKDYDLTFIGYTKDYVLDDNILYVISNNSDSERSLIKFLSVKNEMSFEYIKDVMEKKIYPRYSDIITVNENVLNTMKIADFKMKLYFDANENGIFYDLKCFLGEKETEIDKLNDYAYKIELVESYLNNMGFDDECKLVDKALAFYFMKADLSHLKKYCEIYLSENIKRVKVKTASGFQTRMSYNVGMLDVCFENSEFSDEELATIIKSLKKKIRYVKLNNDTIIEVTEEDAQKLLNTVKEFNLDINNLSEPQSIPLYQALKVTTEDLDIVDYKLDNKLKDLLKDIIGYKELDYKAPEKLLDVMRPYQVDAFKWMKVLTKHNFCGILADDMGLGKTLEVISVIIDSNDNAPTLVVCPKSLCYNWKNEFSIWAGKCEVDIEVINVIGGINDRKEIISNIDNNKKVIYISSYDSLRNDIELYEGKEFKYLILDEAQSIKNHHTLKAKSVKMIKSTNRFVLTGTPIENSINDLWSIFDFLMPNYLGTYSDFRDKYEADIIMDEEDSVLRLVKKIAPFVLRRTKKEVLKDLPDKVESIQIATMSSAQRKVYDAQLLKTRRLLQSPNANKIDILAYITRLRQICVDPKLFIDDYEGSSAKLDLIKELIETYVSSGHKIIIFSQFTSIFDSLSNIIEKMNYKYFVLTGKTNPLDRVEMANKFNEEDDDHKVFLVSLKAGGTGLNLVGADVVIHLDPWWNYAVENQATDRAHRLGQKNAVSVIKVICEDSIEQKVIELQRIKKEIAERIIVSDENNHSNIVVDDLKYLLD